MRELHYIPMKELRRQYRRRLEMKEDVMSAVLMIISAVMATLAYLFG